MRKTLFFFALALVTLAGCQPQRDVTPAGSSSVLRLSREYALRVSAPTQGEALAKRVTLDELRAESAAYEKAARAQRPGPTNSISLNLSHARCGQVLVEGVRYDACFLTWMDGTTTRYVFW